MRKITRVRQRRDALRLLAGVGGGFDEGRRRPLVVSRPRDIQGNEILIYRTLLTGHQGE